MDDHGDRAAPLRVTLLGAFRVCRADVDVPVPGSRLRALLTRLALAGGRPVDPAALVGALWPEQGPADPVNALQSLVSRLRRVLGGAGAVPQAEAGYRLAVAADDVDVLRFERLTATGRDRLRAGDARAAAALSGEAVAVWDAPPGAEPAAVAAVAPAVAARLAGASVEVVADLAEAELALGRTSAAAARLHALLAGDPVHERAAALLIDALAAQGRQADALALYERVRAALADGLGADPGAALRERHLRLLRAADAPAPAGGPAPTPPPAGDGPPPGNLPAPLTSFIGRDDDLARIETLLATGRLVTVTGPGGAGKTRLALEAARRHRHEYRDGAWLVDLASVTEPAKVGAAVLSAIGLRGAALFEASGRLGGEGGELAVLADRLTGRESLLVMDNCEHLIDAVAHLVAALLARCAGLRVLATSREPLAVDGEALVPLGPLELPGPLAGVAEARGAAAVRLFRDRAAAVRPGFDVDDDTLAEVLLIVLRLDGLPLALELAAARLRTLSLTELAAGLSDRFRLLTTGNRTAFPRHRTLRAVIAWSWDLLGEHERTVAERVSVLPGGVTPESAAAVCAGTAVPAGDVPDLLAALVDRSLLQLAAEPGRYRMLETLREYGIGRLEACGTLGPARDLAAGHLARLVAHHDPRLRGPDQLDALRVLRAEYDNALAALRHLCDSGDAAGALALALDLTWHWQMFGRHAEAAYWLGEALAVPSGERGLARDCAEAVLVLSRIGTGSANTLEVLEQHEAELRVLADRLLAYPALPGLAGALTAMTLFFLRRPEASLIILGRLVDGPDVWLAALARMFRAQFAENDGDLDQARVDVRAALDGFARAGDRWGRATVLPMRALLRQYDGDLDGALSDLREARAVARDFGSLSLNDEVFIDMRWIDLHLRQNDPERAIELMAETRERAARYASPEILVLIHGLEAGLWVRIGDLERARDLLEQAETGLRRYAPFGGDHGRAVIGCVRASLCVALRDADGAEAALAGAYPAAVQSRDMPILSLVAVGAAGLADLRGRPREVAALLGAAARLRGTHDRTDPQIRELADRTRRAIGADAFAEAYRGGWELDRPAASARIDPARLRRAALGAAQTQARRA